MTPEVKRKTDFYRLNALKKVLLTAPPTPKMPAKKPESVPPSRAVGFEGRIFH